MEVATEVEAVETKSMEVALEPVKAKSMEAETINKIIDQVRTQSKLALKMILTVLDPTRK